ncbi:hypothetical protein AX769_05630 [Frondihabitans sp. PAMC 28766]|uniref:hypothetical protein n=1 Tax=Frondihabitans sp. PAMC 28766 TaxID=1795630 RepID=UPI00078B9779|nr:hypothetical protein [Frondihabitans sp. PAMC 28766]AMM19720.1 hypothetical protein AX769_05630 [Frondihabitans sp. PAMC 28766]
MSIQLIENVVIGLALVAYLVYRQLRWTGIDRGSIWRLPIVLGIIGVINLSSMSKGTVVGAPDIAFIGIELVIAVVIGLMMGKLTTFRTAARPDSKGRVIEARSGRAGAALWVVLILVRVGLDVLGGVMGAHLLTATGVILLTVAVSRAASALVIDSKLPQAARTPIRR